jgi:hypothetical protein
VASGSPGGTRRELRREVRAQGGRLGQTRVDPRSRDQLLGALTGLAVVGGIAAAVWVGGDRPLAASDVPSQGTLPPAASISPEPVVATDPADEPREPRRHDDGARRKRDRRDANGGGGAGGGGGSTPAADPTVTTGSTAGTGGTGGTGGAADPDPEPPPEPDPEPVPTDKPGPPK